MFYVNELKIVFLNAVKISRNTIIWVITLIFSQNQNQFHKKTKQLGAGNDEDARAV